MEIYEFTTGKFLTSGKELPEDLRKLVEKFQKAAKVLSEQPEEIKERLAPVIVKSAAFIAAELQNKYDWGEDKAKLDKRRRLELEAKAIELLQQQRMKN